MSKSNKNIDEYVFFLGGHDLEMITIRNILKENNFQENEHFFDKKLEWGAKLSVYKKELEELGKDKIPVLIELTPDMTPPENAKIIDHHNENEDKPSSLEQIVELLNKEFNLEIKLDRWMQLVAANDKGYIPAMECLCATEKEIKEIRDADRKAQGVTEEDERLAEESIDKHKTEENGITIIESLTDKFSPINDRMYGRADRLLVFNSKKLFYSGYGKSEIVKKFANDIEKGKAYFGGGKNGFFGLASGSYSKEEISSIKETIINLNLDKKEPLYSHHIFLFPFKWKKWDTKSENSLVERFEIKYFHGELVKKNTWERKQYKLEYGDQFNEYNYFYEYVREILFDLDNDLKTTDTKDNDKLINHFEYKLPKNEKLYYNIKLCDNNGTVYSLEIDSILLNVYCTGTAVLSFHLRNKQYSQKEDILKINKFGRRLYVPFFDLEPDSIVTGEKDNTSVDKLLCATKKNEIPDAIWIGDKTFNSNNMLEDFKKYEIPENYKNGPFLLPKFIEGLFPPKFFLIHEKLGYKDKEKKIIDEEYKIYLRPVLDDRMHVVCWYGNTELINELKKIKECNDFDLGDTYITDNRNSKKHYNFELSDWWYNYIFVDYPSPMHTDRFERQELLKNSTYSRWVEKGTLYGISRFSLVMLTKNFSDTPSFLVRHLQTMYYKMAELCLLQRATVLSFSNEVTHVSNLIHSAKENEYEEILDNIKSLYKHYILFVNKIFFREVTAQEQGIEMYDIMLKKMRIPQDVKDLDNEIDELNRYASMRVERKDAEELKKHTQLATVLLPLAVLAGIFGMNTLPEVKNLPEFLFSDKPFYPFWVSMVFIVFTSGIFISIVDIILKFNIFSKKNRIIFYSVLLIFIIILMIPLLIN